MKIKFNYLLLLALLVSFTQERSLIASRMPLIEHLEKELDEVINHLKQVKADLGTALKKKDILIEKTKYLKAQQFKNPNNFNEFLSTDNDFHQLLSEENHVKSIIPQLQDEMTRLTTEKSRIITEIQRVHEQQKEETVTENQRRIESLEEELEAVGNRLDHITTEWGAAIQSERSLTKQIEDEKAWQYENPKYFNQLLSQQDHLSRISIPQLQNEKTRLEEEMSRIRVEIQKVHEQ